MYTCTRYPPEFLIQIKNVIAPPKCKVKVGLFPQILSYSKVECVFLLVTQAIAKQILAEHASLKGLSGT